MITVALTVTVTVTIAFTSDPAGLHRRRGYRLLSRARLAQPWLQVTVLDRRDERTDDPGPCSTPVLNSRATG